MGSYNKQNLTLMVISYEIYGTPRRLIPQIPSEMTTCVRSSVYLSPVLIMECLCLQEGEGEEEEAEEEEGEEGE